MLNNTQIELIKEYAIGSGFSDTAELGYDYLMEQLGNGLIPDEVVVWYPFEESSPESLAQYIQEQYDVYQTFAEQIKESE
jgi:hypothetical protein